MERLRTNDLTCGHVVIVSSVVYFVFAGYAILFSAFLPLSGIYVCLFGQLSCVHNLT